MKKNKLLASKVIVTSYLDFKNLTAFEADRFVKALENPYPGAWAFVKNKKLRILKSEVSKSNIRGIGRVCIIQKNVNVICKDKAIILKNTLKKIIS